MRDFLLAGVYVLIAWILPCLLLLLYPVVFFIGGGILVYQTYSDSGFWLALLVGFFFLLVGGIVGFFVYWGIQIGSFFGEMSLAVGMTYATLAIVGAGFSLYWGYEFIIDGTKSLHVLKGLGLFALVFVCSSTAGMTLLGLTDELEDYLDSMTSRTTRPEWRRPAFFPGQTRDDKSPEPNGEVVIETGGAQESQEAKPAPQAVITGPEPHTYPEDPVAKALSLQGEEQLLQNPFSDSGAAANPFAEDEDPLGIKGKTLQEIVRERELDVTSELESHYDGMVQQYLNSRER